MNGGLIGRMGRWDLATSTELSITAATSETRHQRMHQSCGDIPLDGFDVRLLVKSYLDKQGVTDNRFNNLPGIDWL